MPAVAGFWKVKGRVQDTVARAQWDGRANAISLLPMYLCAKNSVCLSLINPPTNPRGGNFFFSDKEIGGTEKLLNLQKVTQYVSGRIRSQTQAAWLWRRSLTTALGFAPEIESTLLTLPVRMAMSTGGTKRKRERMRTAQ